VKLLVLEDEPEMATYLERRLSAAGHRVDLCRDGREAFHQAALGHYDVLIVDRMVPSMDGLEVVKALRTAGVQTPALFVTVLDGVGDRVAGLEAGGDDYLVKPFVLTELMARIDAIGRRPLVNEAGAMLRFRDLKMDLIKRTVTGGGARIDLMPQEFKMLEFLVLHAGQVVTRTMLLENTWSFHFEPRTNIVESHISRIRSKLDRGGHRDLIRTVGGSGYQIDADVQDRPSRT
jgi:two-component system OmpR family response regulator